MANLNSLVKKVIAIADRKSFLKKIPEMLIAS